ncbi:Predicted membrane protein [Erythrobacter sp. SD-21]|nr:Predicted membrane protein [Erythrobacter sp. SD-21]
MMAPWHLWLVGVLGALWNGFGCYIYTMAMTRDPEIMASAPPEMVAAFEEAPAWSNGAWALGVWGGLAGSLLLLARSRFALHSFAISLLGLIGTTTYEMNWDVPVDEVQRLAIWAAALVLLGYSWIMRKRGLLR